MTILSVKTGNSGLDGEVRVEFSNGSLISLTEGYLTREFVSVLEGGGRELTGPEEEALHAAAACWEAERAALRLIARAEQSILALIAKLERRGYTAEAVKTVISRLSERNLLNDERYAEYWIRSRLLRKAQSPRWLLISLGKKGIDRDSSHKALAKVLDPDSEFALLLKFIETRGNQGGEAHRFQLKHEGFSVEVLDRYFDTF